MNKINDISGLQQSVPAHKPNRQQESGDFQKVFHQALESHSTSDSSTVKSNALGEIRLPVFHPVEEVNGTLVDQTNSLLTLLDNFAQALGDPSRSLKEIESMVTDLKKNADALSKRVGSQDGRQEGDALQQIAKESAMTASLEYYKFYRGDYI